MIDPRVERLAAVLVDYSTEVRPGDLVVIESTALAAPLVLALCRRILEAGGHPELRIGVSEIAQTTMSLASDDQLRWLNPARVADVERADVRMVIDASFNTRHLSGIDPARQAQVSRAREPLRETLFSRAARGELRWNVTLYPTQAAAQDAEMSLAHYQDFVYRAGLLDRDDPVAEWRSFGARLSVLAAWLQTVSELRVVAADTDLRMSVAGRTWIPCDGGENFPDGEVFTGPVESSVEGEISFPFPASFQGRVVEGVRLVFRGGEVVEATASRGEEFLREMIRLDEGARRVGEFSFGMNEAVQQYTRNTLFDEKIGGTVHLALGSSYPESGGSNRSALHWDLVCDLRQGGEVYADGELVYRDGRFLEGVG